eukprot:RCo049428
MQNTNQDGTCSDYISSYNSTSSFPRMATQCLLRWWQKERGILGNPQWKRAGWSTRLPPVTPTFRPSKVLTHSSPMVMGRETNGVIGGQTQRHPTRSQLGTEMSGDEGTEETRAMGQWAGGDPHTDTKSAVNGDCHTSKTKPTKQEGGGANDNKEKETSGQQKGGRRKTPHLPY